MKKIVVVLGLIGILALPGLAAAADGGQIGVYVAPKFVYGLTQMDGVKGHFTDEGVSSRERVGSKTDDTFGGSIAIGYDFEKKFGVPIRAELEYAGFSEAEAKRSFTDEDGKWTMKQTFGIQTLFLNAYWDINTGTQFTPYIGGGLGMGFINTKFTDGGIDPTPGEGAFTDSTGSKNVTNFAWNVGAGLGYDFTENWTLDVGYRFVGLGSVKTKTYSDDDYKFYGKTDNLYQHQFAVGIRYTF